MIHYSIFGDYSANNESIKEYKEREEIRIFYMNYRGRLSVSLNKEVLLEGSSTLALR
jgi:hypothetical protein